MRCQADHVPPPAPHNTVQHTATTKRGGQSYIPDTAAAFQRRHCTLTSAAGEAHGRRRYVKVFVRPTVSRQVEGCHRRHTAGTQLPANVTRYTASVLRKSKHSTAEPNKLWSNMLGRSGFIGTVCVMPLPTCLIQTNTLQTYLQSS